ncbi:MAG: glycosyl transferase family 1 [Alphaproteobacteria bacterium HGW-Alphaproteobacteria-6]|nr:MAG: glycosyl transferase family 1 [Alphaproteobacteria bacterium HGW-Alphaproteobacteria-6]
MTRPPVVALFPEASFGAALNCVAIAQALRAQGAVPVFICHPGFTGIFVEYGFREYHLHPAARPGPAAAPEDHWQGFINRHLPHFDLSPFDQLATYVGPTWAAIVDTAIAAEPSLGETIARIRPDAIVLDNVIMFPAIANAGCPWIRVVSCAETEIADPRVPPYLSGLDAGDRAECDAFRREYRRVTATASARYGALRRAHGLTPLKPGVFLELSPAMNLLLAPSILRHDRAHPLPAQRLRYLEGCVRTEARYDVPVLPANDGPLVYLSFGSLGAIDTALITRMIGVFADIPARFLVNVGGFPDAYRQVPDNVYLAGWFPQPSVVAQCDLFIHHGGNNSFCEALHAGVPSLVMPYCWDGHDNGRRAETTGTGRRLDRAGWSDADLRAAILGLLADAPMRARLGANAERMRADPGPQAAAAAILGVIDESAVGRDTPRARTGHGA